MRIVLRILLVEFSVAWLMVLVGVVHAGLQALPFFARTIAAAGRRIGWRRFLGFSVGAPVVVGWPLLFWLMETEKGYHLWMRGIAIPWWIVVGCSSLVILASRAQNSAQGA